MPRTKKNPESVKSVKTKKVKSVLVENLQNGLKDLNTETLSTGTFSVVREVARSDISKKRIAVKIKAENPKFIPMYASKDAACADLVANVSPELHAGQVIHLAPGQVVVVDCGFSMALPSGWEAQIRARSHLAEKGIQVHKLIPSLIGSFLYNFLSSNNYATSDTCIFCLPNALAENYV